jgi:SAM-dependent methyltransferase
LVRPLADFDSGYDDKAAIATAVAEGRHREAVGGLWDEIGALQFEFLKRHGLSAGDHLLDIGCGSLRGGVRFAAFLEPGHYWGIDSNESLIDAGYRIELNRLRLTDRVPRTNLLHDDEFNFDRFGQTFDAAIAQSLFTHLPANRIRLCLYRLGRVMRAGGRLFATYFEIPEDHAVDQPYMHRRGGVSTYGYKDPFHYRRSEMAAMTSDLPWDVAWSGDWEHPRDQNMMILERLPNAKSARTNQSGR